MVAGPGRRAGKWHIPDLERQNDNGQGVLADAFANVLRLIQSVNQGLVLTARDHEQTLIQQSLFGSQAGTIEEVIGQRFVCDLRSTAQHRVLLCSGA